MARVVALVSVLLLIVLGFWLHSVARGGLGEHEAPGTPTAESRPRFALAARTAEVEAAAEAMRVARPKQILFGDLHVHTTFSFDAFMLSLPMLGGEGSHPPADACDFARFCSALDFWSINDHAENITPRHWSETVDSIRACNAVAASDGTHSEGGAGGGAGSRGAGPDTVAFLGWEWTQVGTTPEDHYGHKNVILRDLEEGSIPTRPIGSGMTRRRIVEANPFGSLASGAYLHATGEPRLHDLARFYAEDGAVERCPSDVPVRELPADCYEMVDTPDLLFEKLDDWGFPSIVIPHGTTWGFYTPPGSDWAKQLTGPMHDPDRQTLFEIYSGHGSAEEYRDYQAVRIAGGEGGARTDGSEAGRAVCPEPTPGYLPTCWRAGEIIEERCLALGGSESECAERAALARRHAAEAGGQAHLTVPNVDAADWLDAGQCQDCDEPAFNHRPRGSAQYVTALSDFDPASANGSASGGGDNAPDAGAKDTPSDDDPRRFRFGFIASSDNHFARPGTGYKEVHRVGFTESRANAGAAAPALLQPPDGGGDDPDARAQSRPWDPNQTDLRGFALMEMERQASFFLTGGLAAVHAAGRDRGAIWEAFERREVYGTSGPRILLWFDLLNPPGTRGVPVPMGGEVEMDRTPIFRVRAVGSFEQAPGCPDYATTALGPERLERICKGECFNPTARRRPIRHIDVVRIRPQSRPGEPIAPLIEDPWRRFECEDDPAGCAVTFQDPDYVKGGRDTVYYVRAHEAPAPGVNAGGVRCERDADGRCTKVDLCLGDVGDDCLAEHEPRAWSSPIYVDQLD
jgi:hypothetical protein